MPAITQASLTITVAPEADPAIQTVALAAAGTTKAPWFNVLHRYCGVVTLAREKRFDVSLPFLSLRHTSVIPDLR